MRHYKYNATQFTAEYSHQPSAVSPQLTLGKLNHLGALRTIVFSEVCVCVCPGKPNIVGTKCPHKDSNI